MCDIKGRSGDLGSFLKAGHPRWTWRLKIRAALAKTTCFNNRVLIDIFLTNVAPTRVTKTQTVLRLSRTRHDVLNQRNVPLKSKVFFKKMILNTLSEIPANNWPLHRCFSQLAASSSVFLSTHNRPEIRLEACMTRGCSDLSVSNFSWRRTQHSPLKFGRVERELEHQQNPRTLKRPVCLLSARLQPTVPPGAEVCEGGLWHTKKPWAQFDAGLIVQQMQPLL